MKKRKNILFITSDQQHWCTIGIQNKEVKTPNLDRLAKEGILFERAYTVNPTCTPTRASFITGTYPSQHGAYSLGTKLMEHVPVVGNEFLEAGYRTALVGKAHFQPLRSTEEFSSIEAYPVLQDLDFWKNYSDNFYGFENIELARNHTDEAHVGQHYALWLEEQGSTDWRQYFLAPTGTKERSKGRWDIPEHYHYDYWIAERINHYLEQYKKNDENFYLWASFFDPHPQYLVPEPWASLYNPDEITVPELVDGEHENNPPHFQQTQEDNPSFAEYRIGPGGQWLHGFKSHKHDKKELAQDIATYYGMISMMDHYIGKILDKLDDLGLTEDTMVCFTTDHGHVYGHHGLIAKGTFHYEDLLRIPLIVRMPGTLPAGEVSSNLQSVVDLAPTFLDVAEIKIPAAMTGQSALAEWSGKSDALRNYIVVENNHQPGALYAKSYITQQYKITSYQNKDYGELFDLRNDPGEIHNLWNEPSYRDLKFDLIQKQLFAEMEKEVLLMPRIAAA